jgi:hypothetical protein
MQAVKRSALTGEYVGLPGKHPPLDKYNFRQEPKRSQAMLKKGQRVEELTKKTGQRPRVGVVIDLRDDSVEVRWDDGHVSILTGALLHPLTQERKTEPT